MSFPNRQDQFDHWLDDALRQYGNAEPRSGLETRILANLRAAQNHAARRSTWTWILAGSTVSALVIASLWFSGESHEHQRKNATTVSIKAPVLQDRADVAPLSSSQNKPTTTKHAARKARRTNSRLELAGAPRLSQFPSPRPLSEQERLLLAYVREFPKEAAEVAREQAEREKEMEALYRGESDLQQER